MPDTPSTPSTPATPSPGRERHVTEPEVHQDLLDPDGADGAGAGTPGRDENAPGFVKPGQA